MVLYDYVIGAMTGRFEVVGPAWFKLAMLVLVPIRLWSLTTEWFRLPKDSAGKLIPEGL